MTREQAGWTSYEEFAMRKKGKDEEVKERWEIARWQMFIAHTMHPYIKPEKKARTPQKFAPFGWDEEYERPIPENAGVITEQEQKVLTELFSKFKDQNNG